MSEIDEMLVRIERAIEYYEKHTDDFGMPIFLRDVAKVLILARAEAEGAGSMMMLSVQQDCIAAVQRAEATEKREAVLREALQPIVKAWDSISINVQVNEELNIDALWDAARAALEAKP